MFLHLALFSATKVIKTLKTKIYYVALQKRQIAISLKKERSGLVQCKEKGFVSFSEEKDLIMIQERLQTKTYETQLYHVYFLKILI